MMGSHMMGTTREEPRDGDHRGGARTGGATSIWTVWTGRLARKLFQGRRSGSHSCLGGRMRAQQLITGG